MKKILATLLILVFSLPSHGKTYTGEAKKIEKMLKVLFDASRYVSSRKNKSKRRQIVRAFDWNWVAVSCLGKGNWKKQSRRNRNKFRNTLKEIVTLTAFGRMGDFWKGTTYTFEKIDVKGKRAEVSAKFTTKTDSYILGYYLVKSGRKWNIYDLAYEGFRYSENINEQIEAFLGAKSWKELMKRLLARLKGLREDDRARK